MILKIPDELKEEFNTFLEIGLASVTAYPDELTQNEWRLVWILEGFLERQAAKQLTLGEVGTNYGG